jgi:hypothetical protein
MFAERVKAALAQFPAEFTWESCYGMEYLYVEIGERRKEVFVLTPHEVLGEDRRSLTPYQAYLELEKAKNDLAYFQASLEDWLAEFEYLVECAKSD